MVDALKEVWCALCPNGAFLDLRPTPLHREIAVVTPNAAHIAGLVDTAATVADKLAANDALQQVVNDGWFALERSGSFDFFKYLSSFDELQADAADLVKSNVPETTMSAVERLLDEFPDASIRIRYPMSIARYRKLSR
jgi:hypothetical protein